MDEQHAALELGEEEEVPNRHIIMKKKKKLESKYSGSHTFFLNGIEKSRSRVISFHPTTFPAQTPDEMDVRQRNKWHVSFRSYIVCGVYIT